MKTRINIDRFGTLISAITLIISVLLIADKILSTGPTEFILEGGKAVPVEGASYFSWTEVLFFIIAAWLGGMSFIYIILSSIEKESQNKKKEVSKKDGTVVPIANHLAGDEKIMFQNVINNDGLLQRELIVKTGFSEPKVSRLLDKLEGRDLIIRQREGMANRIFLKKG